MAQVKVKDQRDGELRLTLAGETFVYPVKEHVVDIPEEHLAYFGYPPTPVETPPSKPKGE